MAQTLKLVDSLLSTIDKSESEDSNYDKKNVFKLILDGKIPCHKIFETDDCLAVLDAYPMCNGHSLLISKTLKSSLEDFTDIESANYLSQLPRLCKLVKQATGATGVNIVSNLGKDAGQAVFHAHFHVIPRFKGDKLIKLPKSAPKIISKENATKLLNKMGVNNNNNENNNEETKNEDSNQAKLSIFKDEIIPDVIDIQPKQKIRVIYCPDGGDTCYMVDGTELKPKDVFAQPKIQFEGDKNKFYTVVLTDPDAPSRADPKYREWLHWICVNIPGNAVESGDTLVEYVGSGPPKGSGLHRYCFLVYEQGSKFDVSKIVGFPKKLKGENGKGEGRRSFKVRKFAKENGLSLIGGNYYTAQWDESVPKLYKWLGF